MDQFVFLGRAGGAHAAYTPDGRWTPWEIFAAAGEPRAAKTRSITTIPVATRATPATRGHLRAFEVITR